MEKSTKRYLVSNLILMLSIASSFPALAASGPENSNQIELSDEYEVTEDGYIVVEEMPEEMVEALNAVNSTEETQNPNSETGNQHYTIVDNGTTAKLSDELQDYVYEECSEYGISGYEKVILAKLYCESSYNPNLKHYNKNGTYDSGLAQINSSNHSRLKRELGITDFYDPYQSIKAGVYMFSQCLKQNGYNESMALAAYNTGKNGINSTKYSRKVLNIKDNAIVV